MPRINSSRLRHYVEFVTMGGLNDYGEPEGEVLIFDARADVQVKSGRQLAEFGTVLTSEIITVLMYYDGRATNDLHVKWNGGKYEIKHVAPDTVEQSMIVTAERVSK